MSYDYREAMRNDIREWLKENGETVTEANRDDIYDRLWVADSVTGNASGSYTFSTWQAEENIAHNWDLLAEAMTEFGAGDENVIEKGAEWCDVTIRCYLLGEILGEFVTDEEESEND